MQLILTTESTENTEAKENIRNADPHLYGLLSAPLRIIHFPSVLSVSSVVPSASFRLSHHRNIHFTNHHAHHTSRPSATQRQSGFMPVREGRRNFGRTTFSSSSS